MKIPRKICVITGTRAEYGLLRLLMQLISEDSELDLQIIATGMHLSPEFGLTYQEIENDGFCIARKIEMLLSADTSTAISKSVGLGVISFADAYNDLAPDIAIVLGDRFEMLSASIAALLANIPIGHIHGGETTVGAFDEAIRHSITKMSWWHFVAAGEYEKRVIQLGEHPDRVINVGGMGVDSINNVRLLPKEELVKRTGIKFGRKNLLVTFHPVTLENKTSRNNFQSLLDVIGELEDTYIIFTMPNSDSDGRIIREMIDEYVSLHKQRSISFTSMGYLNYLSTLQYIDGVVGNSSSGLTEAPTFKIGTINIGERQKGRLKATSVIDCQPTNESIKRAIRNLYSDDFQELIQSTKNPYGEGGSAEKILNILKTTSIPEEPKKEFYDL